MGTNAEATAVTRRVIEGIYDCNHRGDIPGLFGWMDENIVFIEPGFLPYGGEYRGHASIVKLFGLINEHLDLPRLRIEYLVVDGEHGFSVIRLPGRKGGEVMLAEEWTVRGGKAVQMRIYIHEAAGISLKTGQ